jgi:hypothetical protein
MAQDEQIEKIEEKIEESNTEKAIELVSESDTEIKKHETGEVASNDSSQYVSMEQTSEPVSKQIDFMQTRQTEVIENYRQMAEAYIDFQKKMLDAWTPYFRDVSRKFYNNFISPSAIYDSYYKYLTGMSNLTKMWNIYFNFK